MIYVFIIDTNPSMGHIHQSMSSLDICKCAIEQFIQKIRTIHTNLEKSLILIKSGLEFDILYAIMQIIIVI